jgi:hypothetical protein
MARNGAGSYAPPSNTWNPATPETAILSDDWNTLLADIATAITQSLASDGQTTASARIPFAQGLSVGNGLLTAPSIAVIGDSDTGFFFPAPNAVTLVCGGIAAMQATSTGITFPLAVTFSGSPSIAGNLAVTGSLTVNGNTTIGDAGSDTLSVVATGTFTGNQTFNGTATFTSTVTVPDASFTNAKLATVATATIKGRSTAGTGPVEDLTVTQATALLNPVVGDTGSGGTKGLVPAPAAGDAAKKLYLDAAGGYSNEMKAWGLFDGSTGATVAGRNLSCVRNSLSNFTFTFGAALANADYALIITPSPNGSSDGMLLPVISTKTASGFVIQTVAMIGGTTLGGVDPLQINVQVIA